MLGALVASDAKLPPRFVAAVVLMFGIALGYVNGSDLSTPNAGTVALLGTAAAIFITLLIIVRLCSVVGSRFLPASAL